MTEAVELLHSESADTRTCAERRQARIPPAVRLLWRAAVGASVSRNAKLRAEAARQSRAFVASHAALVGPAVLAKFCASWRTHDLAAAAVLRDLLSSGLGSAIEISVSEIADSWARIARRTLCEQAGPCVDHLRVLSEARPAAFAKWLSRSAVSEQFWVSQPVAGHVYGKRQTWPSVGQLWAILPMWPVGQLLDVVLSAQLQQFVSSVLPPGPRLCVGAVPGSQVLDIAASFQMIRGRFLGDRSTGGLAQGDVATYYDTLGVLRIARALQGAGLDLGVARAVVLMQMCTPVDLSVVGLPACGALRDPRRTWGSLTGVRVAGALGRWPTETTAWEVLAARPVAGVHVDGTGTFALAVYVGNLYTLGASAGAAAELLQAWAALLAQRWLLTLKPSSLECISPARNAVWHDAPAAIRGCALGNTGLRARANDERLRARDCLR